MLRMGKPATLRQWFRTFSLRAWLMVGMAVALLPLMAMAAIFYISFHNSIAQPFREVLHAQHSVLMPLERIKREFWSINVAVNDYADQGGESYRQRFEASEAQVDAQLSKLQQAVREYGEFQPVLDGVEQEWSLVERTAAEVEAGDPADMDPTLERFEDVLAETAGRLETLAEALRVDSEQAHAKALASIRRLEWMGAGALVLALIFSFAAIQIIETALVHSTDELVAGALSISAGDRSRRIAVQVPPELAKVADAFNVMTQQIIRQEEALAEAANTDSLTGLRNRRAFDRIIQTHLDLLRDHAMPFGLLLMDVDKFKSFNDTYGHLAGDEALRQVGLTLRSEARETDHCFRYGGEEFAMILPGLRAEDAVTAAERVRRAIEGCNVILPGHGPVPVTVSIGVMAPRVAAPAEAVVEAADQALYAAKMAGRNRVEAAAV